MNREKHSKNRLVRAVFGCLFLLLSIFSVFTPVLTASATESQPSTTSQSTTSETTSTPDTESSPSGESTPSESTSESGSESTATGEKSCKESLGGALGWLVCPVTGKLAEAVDWLYSKIEPILILNPVKMQDGEPIYEIWKYLRSTTNIIFIIFMLIMIYSQMTGYGISNYGVKKLLPKLIVSAILVNLSFLICSVAVDASNIVGSGLRLALEDIEASAASTSFSSLNASQLYLALGGGVSAGLVAGAIAVETGAIWMLIPTILGAIGAVIIGIIIIALRQAVIVVLIMLAPLAIVANVLPNLDQWFHKWRKIFIQMLIFYPMFSLLFSASGLAGAAIMASSTSGFGLCLGIAVQVLPLFFSIPLLRFSGTVLPKITGGLTNLLARPLAVNRAWAESHRQATRWKNLASGSTYSPSLRLSQFLMDRRIAREDSIAKHQGSVKNRGLAYRAKSFYRNDGTLNHTGEAEYAEMSRNISYESIILRHRNNFEEGVGALGRSDSQTARLNRLDNDIFREATRLRVEQARSEAIAFRNARGMHKAMEDAINAHQDDTEGYTVDKNGNYVARPDYKFHFADRTAADINTARSRYAEMSHIMNGKPEDIQYAAAYAAHAYDSQAKVVGTKMQKYMDLAPPTKDVEYRLDELTKKPTAAQEIDLIIPGLRVLANRGDTDLVRKQIENILTHSRTSVANTDVLDDIVNQAEINEAIKNGDTSLGIHLGTHASQALASFLMFDVGDKDPTLKRYGKYINLETAHAYNKNIRKNTMLSLDEFLTGKYQEFNPATGEFKLESANRDAVTLLEGTSFDKVERTAYQNLDDMLMNAYRREDGTVDVDAYLNRRAEIETAIGPQFISASLKYLSGSEQLKSAVDFLTGFKKGKPRWVEDASLPGASAEDKKRLEEYFREHTIKYFKDQTPSQILGLRSDYRDATMEHLVNAYLDEKLDPTDRDGIQMKENLSSEYEQVLGELAREDLTDDERKDLTKKQKDLRMSMAGAEIRKILDESGKLEQIYNTRRSGAANNAKDWVREWLNLDNKSAINEYLDRKGIATEKKKRRERAAKGESDDYWVDQSGPRGFYDHDFRQLVRTQIDEIYEKTNNSAEPEAEYYELTSKYVEDTLGANNPVSLEYSRYRRQNQGASRGDMENALSDFLNKFFAANSAD